MLINSNDIPQCRNIQIGIIMPEAVNVVVAEVEALRKAQGLEQGMPEEILDAHAVINRDDLIKLVSEMYGLFVTKGYIVEDVSE